MNTYRDTACGYGRRCFHEYASYVDADLILYQTLRLHEARVLG